ncbi:sugar-phosphatase [Clostridium sp.]|uniref:sugar-phosphatase n=1 Tax=Clostridium sp. TaxID=1506 RepID=UPI002A91C402|nr:sugar-phosphatase [Clostridium sp.]MDY6012535.1 sugar-phosphatase [Clostridium sp.]
MYKLIALDMDGTLLNDDKVVSERNKEALRKAKELGVYVVLASGRPIEGLLKFLEELDLLGEDDYVLSYNGCLVQKTKSREAVCDVTLKGRDLKYLKELADEAGLNIHAFSKEKGLITPKENKYTTYEAHHNGIDFHIDDFKDIKDEEDIIKVMMIDEPEILDAGMKKLPNEVYEKYSVAKSAPFFLEFFNKEANKGVGVKLLANHLGIKREEVITVGDEMNDFSMIEYAGLGVAMGNACDKIKEISNFITDTNNNDGVAKVIEGFIIKERI